MEFIDRKDTGQEPQPIELGFLHYMAAGMSLADIRKMSPEDLIKVGNEYLEKEPSAIKAFEKLIKKYSHMKENIKAEDKVSLSELLDGYCSVCGMATCESGCNSKREGTESEDDGYPANLEEGPYSEAYLLGLEDSLKTLVDFLKDQQNNPDTIKHRHVIDQLPELIDTLEDISFSAGYDRAMKEDFDADKAQKEDEEDEERGYDDDGLPLGEDYNQAGEFEPKHLMDLAPGEEFTFNGKKYTFIKMAGGDEITAHVEDSTGFELVVSFGGGMVNTGEVSGTSMADMGQGKGHHIDEEEEDRDEELIAKLTPVSQVLDEGYYGSSDLEQMISDLGYDGFEDFFNDNQGAEEAVEEFILSVKAFRDKLGRTDDEDLYENKLLKQNQLSSAEYQKAKRLKGFNADDYKWDGDLYIKIHSSLNEAADFEIIDKCLADYRKWARKQAPDSQQLYDTTQAFIKTLERLM